MKKSGLSLMLAIGKPKAGDAPQDDAEDTASPEGQTADTGEDESGDDDENAIPLPKGFKPPQDATDGEPFTTTIRGVIKGDKFVPIAIGGMPLDGSTESSQDEAQETPEDENSESSQDQANEDEPPAHQAMLDMIMKKKKSEQAAKSVFQPGR